MSKELPGEWGQRLGPKGIHSYRDVAASVGISTGTAHRLMTGGATSVETVNRVADALFDGDRDLVWRLRGSRRRDHGDWQLPADASLLTPAQRDAIRTLIQVMVPEDADESPAVPVQEDPPSSPTPDDRSIRRALEQLAESTGAHMGRGADDAAKAAAPADDDFRNAQ